MVCSVGKEPVSKEVILTALTIEKRALELLSRKDLRGFVDLA